MAKRRKRHRLPDSDALIEGIDPNAHFVGAVKAERRPDGMPPPELIEDFKSRAKGEGCVCDPQVVVAKSAAGGWSIGLMHKTYCPLLRVLDEQRPED